MEVQKFRKNLSTGDVRPSKITTRSYTLDRESAIRKKINACQKEHLRFELKPGKNFVIELSTGAYETLKSSSSNTIHRTIKQEENKKENQVKEIICEEEYVSPLKVDEINNADTNQAILETIKNKQSIKDRNKASSSPLETDTNNTPDNFMCPCCNKYVEEGIRCDRCDYWNHFQCEKLTSKTREKEFIHKDYICTLCNDDILYDTRTLVESEPVVQEN
ncbi:Hypothetical predicted protein [Mytilus galloprovincialis]|uniref:PHD-type domain-containing protein n=1 Tax=Mytilus galloprovincialis TaxID=29158 RepID=A0A8B6E0A1_MYTGA|nr:Hypothetical predicted protein [Mytilus galloprovincialis]